jgi:hypothetical protein
MVLQAITIAVLIVFLAGMSGPLTFLLLQSHGADLYRASASVGPYAIGEVVLKGLTLVLVFVGQPLALCGAMLVVIDRIHRMTVLERTRERGFLKLPHSEVQAPRTKDDYTFMLGVDREPPVIAGVRGGLASAAIQNIISLDQSPRRSTDLLVHVLLFRGSSMHLTLSLLAVAATVYWARISPVWASFSCVAALLALYGPALVLYLAVISDYTLLRHNVMRESRVTFSQYYNAYREAYRSVNMPDVTSFELMQRILKREALFLLCRFDVRLRIGWQTADKMRLKDIEVREVERVDRIGLPALARTLELIGELRGDRFCFRSHPRAYRLLRQSAALRLLVQVVPIV